MSRVATRFQRPRRRLLALSTVALIAACSPTAAPSGGGTPPSAATSPDPGSPTGLGATYDEVLARANQEGTLNLWSNTYGDPSNIKLLEDGLNAATGAQITIVAAPVSAQDAVTRLVAEQAAGKTPPSADVLESSASTLQPLADAGLIMSVDWEGLFGEKFEGIADRAAKGVPAGKGLELGNSVYTIVYNTELISADELPKTWEELADPTWAGKFAADPRGYPFNYFAPTWGEERVLDLVTRIAANNPLWVSGASNITAAISQGEVAFGLANTNQAEVLKAQGQPIDWYAPSEVPVVGQHSIIVEGTPHPNATALFNAWRTSEEGREVLWEVEKLALAWPNVGSPIGDKLAADGVKFEVPVDQADVELSNDILAKLGDIIEAAQGGG